jgi:HlyD family secretion protein
LIMRLRIGWLAGAIAFVAITAGIAWSIWPKPILVETARVTKGRFVATVDEDGKTRIRERYVVAAPLSGRLTRIRLKAGDRVNSDDVIATIFSPPTPLLDPRSRREAEERLGTAEAAQARAKALVDRAQAQSAQADQELTRTRTLVERAASTAQALERAELAKRVADRDLRAAEFQLHATQHELDQTRALLAKYTDSGGSPPDEWSVTAPVSGLVLKVDQESERIVQPGTPILEIGDPRDLEIVVDVLSTDAVEIKPGADVVIEHWGGPDTLSGRVRRVEPAAFTKVSTLGVEEQRVNVLIDILDPPEKWSGLGEAYQVDTKIVVFTQDDVTIVPSGALFRRGGDWNVFLVENGRAQERPVTLIRRSGATAAVASGLKPGDILIVYPNDRVTPGIRIRPSAK